jgi:hypothetical protein
MVFSRDVGPGYETCARMCLDEPRSSCFAACILTVEVGMARRRIGQENLLARPAPRSASSLTELAVNAEADLVLPHFLCCGSSFRGGMST